MDPMTLYEHVDIRKNAEALGAQEQPIAWPGRVFGVKIEDNKEVACEVEGELEDGCVYKVKNKRTNKLHALMIVSNPDSAQRQ